MSKVVVIGSANVDILAKSQKELIPHDSNIGKVNVVYGGVAHNIASNLRCLQVPVEFISAFSTDSFGQMLYRECISKGMSLLNCQFFDNYPSAAYVAVVDNDNELNVGVCDCSIMDHLNVVQLYPLLRSLSAEDILLLDTNLLEEKIIDIIANTKAKIFCDPISTTKCLRLKDCLDKIYMFKPNYLEALAISGLTNPTDKELLDYFVGRGIKEIAISKGEDGVIGTDGLDYFHIESCANKIVSTNGAGDAFTSGYIYAYLKGLPFVGRLILAEVCSSITLSSSNAVSELLDEEMVKQYFDIVKKSIKVDVL